MQTRRFGGDRRDRGVDVILCSRLRVLKESIMISFHVLDGVDD